MASVIYEELTTMIKCRKEFIEHEFESRNYRSGIAATEVMCATWYIKGQFEKMHNDLDGVYWANGTKLTRMEYLDLNAYINRLEDYYWNLLYDEAMNINKKYIRKEI